jgi:outer membrane protein assembly factor BamB
MCGPFYDTPSISGDTIYLCTIAHVYALNRNNGSLKWKYAPSNYYYTTPVVDANGTLYFASLKGRNDPLTGYNKNDGILHCITDNGQGIRPTSNWTYRVCANARLAPPALGTDGTLYISATDNKIYAIV